MPESGTAGSLQPIGAGTPASGAAARHGIRLARVGKPDHSQAGAKVARALTIRTGTSWASKLLRLLTTPSFRLWQHLSLMSDELLIGCHNALLYWARHS